MLIYTGCDDPVCEACVCTIDQYCCTFEWDNTCVGEAEYECANSCNCGGPTTSTTIPTTTSTTSTTTPTTVPSTTSTTTTYISTTTIEPSTTTTTIPEAHEFGSLTVVAAILLATPAFAYLVVKRKR